MDGPGNFHSRRTKTCLAPGRREPSHTYFAKGASAASHEANLKPFWEDTVKNVRVSPFGPAVAPKMRIIDICGSVSFVCVFRVMGPHINRSGSAASGEGPQPGQSLARAQAQGTFTFTNTMIVMIVMTVVAVMVAMTVTIVAIALIVRIVAKLSWPSEVWVRRETFVAFGRLGSHGISLKHPLSFISVFVVVLALAQAFACVLVFVFVLVVVVVDIVVVAATSSSSSSSSSQSSEHRGV